MLQYYFVGDWRPSNPSTTVFVWHSFSLPYNLSSSVGRCCTAFVLSFGLSFAGFFQSDSPRSILGPLPGVPLTFCAFPHGGIFVFHPVLLLFFVTLPHESVSLLKASFLHCLKICFQVHLLPSLDLKFFLNHIC